MKRIVKYASILVIFAIILSVTAFAAPPEKRTSKFALPPKIVLQKNADGNFTATIPITSSNIATGSNAPNSLAAGKVTLNLVNIPLTSLYELEYKIVVIGDYITGFQGILQVYSTSVLYPTSYYYNHVVVYGIPATTLYDNISPGQFSIPDDETSVTVSGTGMYVTLLDNGLTAASNYIVTEYT